MARRQRKIPHWDGSRVENGRMGDVCVWGVLMLSLKVPKEPSNHRIKKTPQSPAPQRKKAQREPERSWRIEPAASPLLCKLYTLLGTMC